MYMHDFASMPRKNNWRGAPKAAGIQHTRDYRPGEPHCQELIHTFTPLTVPAKKARREFVHFSKIPAGEKSEQAADVKECSLSSYMLS